VLLGAAGTPVSSKLEEIRGLLEFLAAEPYHRAPCWRALLQTPYEERNAAGLLALRSLLRDVMLRRTQQQVGACGPRSVSKPPRNCEMRVLRHDCTHPDCVAGQLSGV
jgi:hypothetical protein